MCQMFLPMPGIAPYFFIICLITALTGVEIALQTTDDLRLLHCRELGLKNIDYLKLLYYDD